MDGGRRRHKQKEERKVAEKKSLYSQPVECKTHIASTGSSLVGATLLNDGISHIDGIIHGFFDATLELHRDG
jgi:hypothetical protein